MTRLGGRPTGQWGAGAGAHSSPPARHRVMVYSRIHFKCSTLFESSPLATEVFIADVDEA